MFMEPLALLYARLKTAVQNRETVFAVFLSRRQGDRGALVGYNTGL